MGSNFLKAELYLTESFLLASVASYLHCILIQTPKRHFIHVATDQELCLRLSIT